LEIYEMRGIRILLTVAALLTPLLALGASGAIGAPAADAGPTISYQGTYPITVAAGDYDLTYLVLDFAPGAEIPLHYHGGPALIVGMEGMLTLRPEGQPEHMLMPGDVMNEKAGARHAMINTTNADTKVMAVVLLPKGAQLTTVVDTGPNSAPGPTVPLQGDYPLTVAAGDYSLVNLMLDFAPGAEIPLHYHGGPVVLVGMDGTLTLRPEGAAEHALGPREVMNEPAGVKHVMINTSSADARILAGVLLPKGAELTTVVAGPTQPTGMPVTGSGGTQVIVIALVLIALLLLLQGGLVRFARSRKR
jgi:quercetin dioxygenase-like cupin family protein